MLFQKYVFGKLLHSRTADFASKCHFVCRWKNIYWKIRITFDASKLHIHLKNLKQECSYTHLFQNSPSPHLTKTPHLAFHFVSKWKSICLKEVVGFWWRDPDCVSIVTELCDKFITRVLLNIFWEFPPPPFFLPWKW